MKQKKCIECGEAVHGRADKKFCDDACRNSHNNKQNRDVNNFVRNINNILRRNRKILALLNIREKTAVTKEALLGKGFSFSYYTNVYKTKGGKVYYFCYDQGYLPLEKDRFALVVKKEYVS